MNTLETYIQGSNYIATSKLHRNGIRGIDETYIYIHISVHIYLIICIILLNCLLSLKNPSSADGRFRTSTGSAFNPKAARKSMAILSRCSRKVNQNVCSRYWKQDHGSCIHHLFTIYSPFIHHQFTIYSPFIHHIGKCVTITGLTPRRLSRRQREVRHLCR